MEKDSTPAYNKVKEKHMATNTTTDLDFAAIDQLITNKELKLDNFAKANGYHVGDLRASLVNHYGDRIVFKRGRNGGVRWTTPNKD